MARHTFVTESHAFGDEKKTVEILSRSEVEDIAAEAAKGANSSLIRKLAAQDRKLASAAEQAAAAAKDAAEAKEEVKRLVETARETFREVIEEMLAPHYRLLALLAQHLGIELPAVAEKPKTIAEHPIGEEINEKPAVIKKKKTVVRRAKKKGGA